MAKGRKTSIPGIVFVIIGAVMAIVSNFKKDAGLELFAYLGYLFLAWGVIKMVLGAISSKGKKKHKTHHEAPVRHETLEKVVRKENNSIPANTHLDIVGTGETCRKCGYPLRSPDKFCGRCGYRLLHQRT